VYKAPARIKKEKKPKCCQILQQSLLIPWLAIHACHHLLKEGRRRQKNSFSLFQETLVQTKLFNSDDYKSWCTNTANPNTWKHKNLMKATKDEVEELFDKS